MTVNNGAALVADLVGSRGYPDRVEAQRRLSAAIKDLNARFRALIPLKPSVGDEFQGMYETANQALVVTLMLRLSLPDTIDCRFGIGVGNSRTIDDQDGLILDGSAWWAARDAINETKRRAGGKEHWLRTWIVVSPDAQGSDIPDADLANAYLLCRDELIRQQTPSSRRALLGQLRGETQQEVAHVLGVTQPSVSSALAKGSSVALSSSTALLWGRE